MMIIPSLVPSSCPTSKPRLFQTDDLPALSNPPHGPVQLDINTVIEYLLAISDKLLTALSTPSAAVRQDA